MQLLALSTLDARKKKKLQYLVITHRAVSASANGGLRFARGGAHALGSIPAPASWHSITSSVLSWRAVRRRLTAPSGPGPP